MDFVSHFRNSAPYIHAYRGKTSVIWLRDQVLDNERLTSIISDLTLLNSLGLRLVVLFDADCFATRLNDKEAIDETSLDTLVAAIGRRRYVIEALFSQGLANSPMHGARIRVVGGNFVMARPAGVFNGIDLKAQGRVRRIDHLAIREHLDKQHLVLMPPLGYSITGDILYLPPEQLLIEIAKQIGADKVIIVGDNPLSLSDNQKEMGVPALEQILSQADPSTPAYLELQVAALVSRAGIPRCHVIDGTADGSLLAELFTRDGVGTLIALDQYDTFRQARIEDVQGILALLRPLEEQNILVRRDPEKLENEINHFYVNERDGMIIGCAAIYKLSDDQAELACVTVHSDYQKKGRGDALLSAIEKQARKENIKNLFVLTTQTEHWFVERGFRLVSVQDLPETRQKLYNIQRNSKIYMKLIR
ncbi:MULTISPECIES: amino-acid N-acetyltransferase [Reinekea]|jgi:amino-acid N-acetyltransferase|uniref:Amino-acid acetyltransferase n=1 Tax=Reinekea forsetii TaxID=1336806 RepID=A0A2K8KSW9_9GAMM|nr:MULTISPECIES: amino-acid N-acetyltransferase [Reinekea]ATX77830.1 N-acetylglutamate synthase [Reinekea forsetii]MDO7640960.1 amino-acid N-acetyltransferase [Reinekea forsetii]MDO7645772.1 amino-acid N-acetyltransferase [Reinekea forsetii]